MTLQKLDIPRQMIAGLYGENLVRSADKNAAKQAIAKAEEAPANKPAENIDSSPHPTPAFLGENRQHVLWLVNDDQNEFADEAGMKLLTGIIQACGLSMLDVAVINLHRANLNFESVKAAFQPKRIIALGSTFGFFPANLPLYVQMQFDDTVVVTGASLQTMQTEKEAKAKLWSLLKSLFGK